METTATNYLLRSASSILVVADSKWQWIRRLHWWDLEHFKPRNEQQERGGILELGKRLISRQVRLPASRLPRR
jgi:hypothetical protein